MASDTPGTATHAPRLWRIWGQFSLAATILIGAVYALTEWSQTGTIGDIAQIALVTLNAFVTLRFGHHIAGSLGHMFALLPDTRSDPQAAVDRVLGHPASVPFGLAFATLIAFGVMGIAPWPFKIAIQVWLSLFLFSGNLLIGAAIFAIFQFWIYCHSQLPKLDFRILNLTRPPLLAFLVVNGQVVMVTAALACFAILAVVLSGYEIDTITMVFSICTLLLVIATYAVPVVPLSYRLQAAKAAELNRIEQLIEAHIRRMTGRDMYPDGPPRTPSCQRWTSWSRPVT